jgi:hypothetical protein
LIFKPEASGKYAWPLNVLFVLLLTGLVLTLIVIIWASLEIMF